MAENGLKIENLRHQFSEQNSFRLADIVEFYRKFEDDVKRTTVSWKVYTLVQMGVLQRISRGVYVLGEGQNYLPELSSKMRSIYKKIRKEFPYLNICIWNTKWLNEFMVHQPNTFYLLLEVEKEAEESVFYYLTESNSAVFLNPSKEIFEKYLPKNKEVIFIKSLVSEAPLISVEGIKTASIEKILVDIFCGDVIFSSYQGFEMQRIFESALTKYTVNQSKMLRYANRRGKKDEIAKFTDKFTQIR